MKNPRSLASVLALSGILIAPAVGQTVAIEIAADTIGNQNFGGALGMDFVVNEAITITELGCFDSGSDGLSLPITVELWERNDNGTAGDFADDTGDQILAQSEFSPAEPGTLEEGNRFKPLDSPVDLEPGAYTIVGWGYGDAEQNGNDGGVGNFPTTVTDSALIDFVGSSRFGDANANGQFPNTPDGGPATRYGSGNFKFVKSTDSDGDGLPDLWEDQFGLNMNDPDDADDDGDMDGLNNLGEFAAGTDPTDEDTDGDTLKDGDEVNGAGDRPPTNPRVSDSDGDELSDLVETNTGTFVDEDDTGTDPTKPDTDDDTYSDKREILAGTNPNDPAPPFPPEPFTGTLAISSDQTVGNQDFGGSLGSDFIVHEAIEVTQLGAFDDTLDGIAGNLGVAIFERNDGGTPLDPADDSGGAIVTETTFTSADPGTLSGSYRIKDVAAVTLEPGAYTVAGWGFSALDRNGNDGNLGNWPTTIDDGGGLIEFVGTSRFGDAAAPGTFPGTLDGGPTVRYGAGNFAYRALTDAGLRLQLSGAGSDLVLRWNSRPGKVYDILWTTDLTLDPSTWPVYLDRRDIVATPETNFATVPRPGDLKAFFAIREKDAPPIFADDFEGGQGGWTVGVDDTLPGDTNWEFGSPSNVGPPAANSGVNCFGTNLAANYETDADIWLRSPAIDLTDGSITGASVRFSQTKDIELMFDGGLVRVLDAATDLPLGAEVLMDIDGTTVGWEQSEGDLPPEALGKSIKLEFRFNSDNFGQQAGWYIDDVEVRVE